MGFCGLVTSRILQIRGEVLFPAFKSLVTLGTKKMQNPQINYLEEILNLNTLKKGNS